MIQLPTPPITSEISALRGHGVTRCAIHAPPGFPYRPTAPSKLGKSHHQQTCPFCGSKRQQKKNTGRAATKCLEMCSGGSGTHGHRQHCNHYLFCFSLEIPVQSRGGLGLLGTCCPRRSRSAPTSAAWATILHEGRSSPFNGQSPPRIRPGAIPRPHRPITTSLPATLSYFPKRQSSQNPNPWEASVSQCVRFAAAPEIGNSDGAQAALVGLHNGGLSH